ncbi:MAG: AAA family ATPase [Epsilonproteobacteria bacterium]|nr:AAA family ATPase [Campylobacterota bacterium]
MDSQEIIKKLYSSNIFLTGGAGVGKSYITKEIIKYYPRHLIATAPTGIAAVNIGGQTIHSLFEFSRNISKFNPLTYPKKKLLQKTDLIIIDEISMVSKKLFDAINIRLQEVEYKGKLLIVGDFYQLPPVNVEEEGWAFESTWWDEWEFETITLTQIKRTNHKEFSEILLRIREGSYDDKDIAFIDNLKHNKHLKNTNLTFLYSTNKKVDHKNKEKLKELPSPLIRFKSDEELFDTNKQTQFENFKQSLNIGEIFEIKKGAVVLNVVNQKMDDDVLYNGEKGVVVDIDEENEIIKVDFLGKIVNIEKYPFELIEYDYDGTNDKIIQKTIGVFYQFPLKLAYAITIHKAQGLSIDHLAIDLSYIFAPAQAYVALSRGTNPNNIVINPPKGKLDEIFYIDERVKKFYQSNTTQKKLF